MYGSGHLRGNLRGHLRILTAVLLAAAVALGADTAGLIPQARTISGTYAALLAASTDLGAARDGLVQVTAELRDGADPNRLAEWSHRQGLDFRWHDGEPWAVIEGPPAAVATAFDVPVHDYRGRDGEVFYAHRGGRLRGHRGCVA